MSDTDEEEFFFYGTPLEDDQDAGAGSWKKVIKDPSLLRSIPVQHQVATDSQGRRRFHGAFTGGFSAGYYNSVGSAEGFQPGEFRSSRVSRAEKRQQRVEDFLDEDELEEQQKTRVQVQGDYDTFGSAAAAQARFQAASDIGQRPGLVPGLLVEEVIVPVANSIGMRLLQRMGWRPGRGIGSAVRAGAQRESKWGTVAGVSVENTPLYVLEPKEDLHGLGYDPFKGAEEFRQHKLGRKADEDARGTKKRSRGLAFGTGALEESDTLGYLEDYVDESTKRTDRHAFGFEEISDESDDEDRFQPKRRKGPLAVEGPEGKLLLQSKEQLRGPGGSFIAGFSPASLLVDVKHYPPPQVPEGFNFSPDFSQTMVDKGKQGLPPPPEVPAPADATLRKEVDSLAALVARSGDIVEQIARKQAVEGSRFGFLLGGPGADYYKWRLSKVKAALDKVMSLRGQKVGGKRTPGEEEETQGQGRGTKRKPPLTVDERMAMLGETPLPSNTKEDPTRGSAAISTAPGLAPLAALSEADRQRLAGVLGKKFVSSQSKDDEGKVGQTNLVAGIRYPRREAERVPDSSQVKELEGKPTGSSPLPTQPGTLPPSRGQKVDIKVDSGSKPVRVCEDWRPEPLLCRRFNVPDPYKGKAPPLDMNKAKGEYLAELGAAVELLRGGGQGTPAPEAHEKKLPAVLLGDDEDEEDGTITGVGAGHGAAGSHDALVEDIALSWLGELEVEFKKMDQGAGQDQRPQPVEKGPQEEEEGGDKPVAEKDAAVGHPLDIFKAIFEDENEEDEDDEGSGAQADHEGDGLRQDAPGTRQSASDEDKDQSPPTTSGGGDGGGSRAIGRHGTTAGPSVRPQKDQVWQQGAQNPISPSSGLTPREAPLGGADKWAPLPPLPGIMPRPEASPRTDKEDKKKSKDRHKRKEDKASGVVGMSRDELREILSGSGGLHGEQHTNRILEVLSALKKEKKLKKHKKGKKKKSKDKKVESKKMKKQKKQKKQENKKHEKSSDRDQGRQGSGDSSGSDTDESSTGSDEG